MDSDSKSVLLEVFLEAAKMNDLRARAAYLDKSCGDNTEFRRRVEALLSAEEKAGGPPPEAPPSAPLSGDPALGSRIGHYKLLQQIGEGGCGVVFMAEQEQPVRRKVALKVIKLGMDTKQVVARFEAERQALAMMDHPNIAQVFEAGATDSGRPFFVMELVRGIKITEYCDEQHLSTLQRLELFMQVCHAVQHAHQKGIIHRDLKPSNILVTELDGKPLPKIIDFGIAKAVEGRLTDQTLFTAFEQFIGTPAYMSPEQAAMNAADVDTRSDIYSLGVLLYELLTGKTPFETKALLASGLDAMRRTISEQMPARPSNRFTSMAPDQLKAVARARGIESSKFARLLAGDLDWIVMKCLEKERGRRYETASGLATDVQRYLDNEPIVARPPSRIYEFRKTVRRHWVGFAATAAVILVLVAGVVFSAWQAARARRAEWEERRSRADAEFALKVSQWADEFVPQRLGEPGNAVLILERGVQRWPDLAHLWYAKGLLLEADGRFQEAVQDLTRAIELIESAPDQVQLDLSEALLTRSRSLMSLDRFLEAGHDVCRAKGIPLRDTNAPSKAVDLSPFYVASLTGDRYDLSGLPTGLSTYAGLRFDVRGIVSLNGSEVQYSDIGSKYPLAKTKIQIQMKFSRLRCLMGTGWSEQDGIIIGTFILHYAHDRPENLPVRYGIHVRDYVAKPTVSDDDLPLEHGEVVWTGTNDFARKLEGHLRLYVATWVNPHPKEEVSSVDFISTMTRCAPFLIAMTVEP